MPTKILSRLLDRREEFHWKPREFAAELELLPLSNGARERLTVCVRAFNERHHRVPGVLQAHFLWPAMAALYGREVQVENSYGPLFFYCKYEGDLEDVLSMLFEACPELHDVLRHAWGYDGARDDVDGSVRQLTAARTRPSPALRRSRPPARKEWRKPQPPPLPLMTPFERLYPGEDEWTERMSALLETRMRRANREARGRDPKAVALRGAHVKHHGLLDARFVVRDDIPPELRCGVFAKPASYQAHVRVSNMSEVLKPDTAGDARGLAIKLYDVDGCGERVAIGDDRAKFTQDFNLASDPAFFLGSIRDYAIARSILSLRDRKQILTQLALYFVRRPSDAWIFARSVPLCRPDHPLNLSYHSMTTHALGTEYAVKYLVRPLPPKPAVVSGKTRSPNHLRAALRRSLDPVRGRPLRLEFCVVVPEKVTPEWTEDPRLGVRKTDRIVPMATIEIERQDPCSDERMRLAEELVFSPWHTFREHRPLGNLSRARLLVYRTSSALRAAVNRAGAA